MPLWLKGDPHYVHPNPEMLEGIAAIATYIQRGYTYTYELIREGGLPAIKNNQGRWITSKRAVLAWILAGVENSPLKQDPLVDALLKRTQARVKQTSLDTSLEPEKPICPYTGDSLPSQYTRMDAPTELGDGGLWIKR